MNRIAIIDYFFAKRKEVFGRIVKDFANTAVLMRKCAGARAFEKPKPGQSGQRKCR